MADAGKGFVIPATVELDLANTETFLARIRALIAAAEGAARTGQQPIDPSTGMQMSQTDIRKEVGRTINEIKAAQKAAAASLARDDPFHAELERQRKRVLSSTTDLRRDVTTGKVLPPIYDAGPRPSKEAFRKGVTEAGDALFGEETKKAAGATKKARQAAEKVAKELEQAEDPIARMVKGYRDSAALSKRIADNEKKVLNEQAKAEVAKAKASTAYASRFDPSQADPDKAEKARKRVLALAEAGVAEDRRRLQQRNMEIGLTRATGGEQLLALNRMLESGLQRAIKIQQIKLELDNQSAKSMAEEKLLREQLNRDVEKEVRRGTTKAVRKDIAEERAAVQRQLVLQERENLKAVTDDDRKKRAIRDREVREAEAKQQIARQQQTETTRGQALVRKEARVKAIDAVNEAKARQEYLKQFDVATPKGRERTGVLAETAVREQQQALAQRAAEIRKIRETDTTGEQPGVKRIAETRQLEAILAREVSIEQTKLDLASGAAKSMAEQKLLNDKLAREIAQEVRLHTDYVAVAQENLRKQREQVLQRRITRGLETPADRFNLAQDKIEEERRQREIDRYKRVGTDKGEIARDRAERERDRIAQEMADRKAITPADRQAKAVNTVEARLAAAEQRLAENAELRTAAGQKTLQAEAALAADTQELKAQRARLASVDMKLIAATAEEANAREEQAARVALLRGGALAGDVQGYGREELLARAAIMKRTQADLHRAEVARRTTAEDIEAAAQKKLAEAKLRVALQERERQIFREAAKGSDASLFQRLQSALSPRSGRLPEENLNLKQFVGDKFQRTVGYAASGAALGLGVAAISEMFRDAMELEQTFVRLRGQMEGIGKVDAFPKVRDQIREIAAETGQASNIVGGLYQRMLGLAGDPVQAATDAAAASKLMTVTGLDQKTMLQSLLPVQKAFGVNAEQIGDQVVTMGEKFGISEDELTEFLGKTSVTAKNAGLSLEELVAIGGNMANSLGKPISSSSEAINKSFSLIEKNALKIFDILRANPETEGAIAKMSKALGAGDTGQALIELLRASTKFTDAQRQGMLTNVVSRRESEEFNALLSNAAATLEDLDQGAGDTAGRLNARFSDLKETVALTFQSIRANFEAMGDLLFKAGLSDWLRDIGAALGIVVGGVNLLIGTLASLNEIPLLGGLVTTAGRIAVTTFALIKMYKLFGSALNWVTGATKQQTAAETENAASKGRTTVANEGAAVSERGLAAARQSSTAATQTQTRTSAATGGVPYTYSRSRGYSAVPAGEAGAGAGGVAAETAAVGNAARIRAYRDNLRERVDQNRAVRESTRAELRSAQAARTAARTTEQAAIRSAREAARQPLGQRLSSWMLTPWGDPSGRLRQPGLPSGPSLWERGRTRFSDFRADRTSLYESRRGIWASRFAEQAEAGTLGRATFGQRALAGGTLFRAPAADAKLAATGASAFGSSPLIIGAIALAGAAAIKSAYDDQKEKVEASANALQTQLRNMNVQQLQQIGEYRTNLIEKVAMAAFGVKPPDRMIETERRLAETSEARRAIGAYVRPEPAPLAKAGEEIAAKQQSVDQQMAERLTPQNREEVIRKLMETTEGRLKAQDLGLIEWATGVDEETGRSNAMFDWQVKTDAESFTKLVNYTRTATGEEAESLPVSTASQGIFDALKRQGNAADLVGRAGNLKDAASAIAGLQEGNKSVDETFVAMGNNLAENAENKLKTIDELNKEFEGGKLSQGEYLAELRRRLPDIERTAREAPTSEFGKQAKALGIEINTQINRVANASLTNYENLTTQLQAMGSLTPKQVTAKGHAARLLKVDEATQFKELPQIMEEEIAAQEEMWGNIFDPQARLDAMAKGVSFSEETREVFLKRGIQESEKAVSQIAKLAKITGQDPAELRKTLARQAAKEGKSLEAVATEWIDKQIGRYKGMTVEAGSSIAAAEYAQGKLNELNGAREGFVTAFGDVPAIPEEAPSESKQALDRINTEAAVRQADRAVQGAYLTGDSVATAMLNAAEARDIYNDMAKRAAIEGGGVKYEDLRKAEAESIKSDRAAADAVFNYSQRVRNREVILAAGDPVLETAARIRAAREKLRYARSKGNKDDAEAAEQELMQLDQQAAENVLNIERARMQHQMALVQEDPTQAAIKQLQAAEFELAHAKGEADREQKQAAVISARQNLNNTISNAISADASLAITLANLRGDTVGAATTAAQEAKRRLDEAIAKGITDRGVLAPLEASLAEANKQLYLAPIQKQISDLDYLYGLEQLSLGDYIAMLEQQLAALVYDSQEYRDLNMKIFNLKKTASADLGWSIPGQLSLPTLYETRRAGETIFKAGGGPYQDNRNINVNIAVNGTQDPLLVAQQVQSALNDSLRGGQTYTAGIPVAAGV